MNSTPTVCTVLLAWGTSPEQAQERFAIQAAWNRCTTEPAWFGAHGPTAPRGRTQ